MIDTTSASGELILNIFSALAQFERRLIQEGTKAGLAAARSRGKKGGRPPMNASHPIPQKGQEIRVSIPQTGRGGEQVTQNDT